MSQRSHAAANKRRKTEVKKIAQDSIFQNVDDNTVDTKSVCSSVVDLTDDAWLLVFDYLCIGDKARIAGVCKRWRELARISWKSITRLALKDIFKPSSDCGSLSHQWTDTLLEVLAQKCGTRLWHLDLSNTSPYSSRWILYIGEDGLRSALQKLQSLKSLNVSRNYRITGEFFSQAPKSLTEVIVRCCDNLTDRGVRFLAKRCANLETIDISWCRSLTGQSITDLAKNCPQLKRFRFGVCGLGKMNVLTSHLVTLSNLPLLEELGVDGRHCNVTDQVFYELGRHCPLLRSISCAQCYQLTDAAIHSFSPCLHLETIDLSWCDAITDQGWIQLSSAHPELKEVRLGYCQEITDEGVGRLLMDHPNLLELDISALHVTDRVLPMLESSLQRREHKKPLQCLMYGTLVSRKKVNAFTTKYNNVIVLKT